MHQNMGEMLLFYSDCTVLTIESVPRFFWFVALQSGGAPSTGQIGLALSSKGGSVPSYRLYGHALSWENLSTCPTCPVLGTTPLCSAPSQKEFETISMVQITV